MELEERVAELERRLAALERADRDRGAGSRSGARGADGTAGTDGAESPLPGGDLWALHHLKSELKRAGSPGGGVLYTGSVRLPAGERYEWQYGALTDGLLAADWSGTSESFAALGHPVRLRLLREILGGRRTTAELAEVDGLGTTGQLYHHLRQLTGTGWLHTPGRGRYEIPAARVVPLLVMITAAGP
ncbi:ArsR/SmtB family transcription factor [Streptomyces sp. NPDC056987]|uniref:ArsR/SmtB family transcription factor n=1 Tax=Streptomyces sp. NPDC056987 TaxID=3345988 RepID=UPI00363E615F